MLEALGTKYSPECTPSIINRFDPLTSRVVDRSKVLTCQIRLTRVHISKGRLMDVERRRRVDMLEARPLNPGSALI